jgi:hypothetical protein
MTRSTTEVVFDHLSRRLAGDLEGDLRSNYDDDVLVLSSFSTFRGWDGVRQSAALLEQAAHSSEFHYNRTVVEGEYGFLEWTASENGDRSVSNGSDSYHVVDGRIVMQSIHYTALPLDE